MRFYIPHADSPAVDAGDDAAALQTEVTLDQRGGSRFVGTVDIGSVELQATPEPAVSPSPYLSIGEGDSMAVEVCLTAAPSAPVTVAVSRPAGGSESVTVDKSTLIFDATNWDSPQSVLVSVADDADVKNDSAVISLTSPGMATVRLAVDAIDDDFRTYVVDDLGDVVEADGALTLREALLAADTDTPVGDAPGGCEGAADRIVFSPAFFSGGSATIALGGEELEISSNVEIHGPGPELLTIDGGRQSRILQVGGEGSAVVEGLTITGGRAEQTVPRRWEDTIGGGIYNAGTLKLNDVAVSGNSSEMDGGGIYSEGELTIVGSAIVGNACTGEWTGYGGGICSADFGRLTVVNSLVACNAARGAGGIYNGYMSDLTVTNSTIVANEARDAAAGICSLHPVALDNSIVGLNRTLERGQDLDGILQPSSNGNLIGIDPRFVRNPSDGGDGWLDDPATTGIDESANNDYGDLRPRANSPAVDFGFDAAVPAGLATDLAGNPRIYGAAVDIGAYEMQSAPSPNRETPSPIVTTLDDTVDLEDDLISLREALFYAQGGAISSPITFDASLDGGTISLAGTELRIDTSATVDASALSSLTVDANHASRVFMVGGDGVVLDSLTIVGGTAAAGGAIGNLGTLTLANSTVTDSFATGQSTGGGGGIYNAGVLAVTDSEIAGNSSESNGGGVSNDYGATLSLLRTTVQGNSGDGYYSYGGGIYNDGTLFISKSVISDNTAAGDWSRGGGISNTTGAATVVDSVISKNSSESCGGGISNDGSLTVTNSTLWGNSAAGDGGGLYNDSLGVSSVANSTIVANAADQGGGIGHYAWSGLSATTLYNTIVANNVAATGTDFFAPYGSVSGSHNLIGDGSDQAGLVDGEDGNLIGTCSDPVDPVFVRVPSDGGDGWGDDPLTTDVDESANDDDGDLHLTAGSPAVDAGDNALLPPDSSDSDADGDTGEPLPLDLDGSRRVQDGDDDGVATVDMGAYEYFVNVAPIPGDLSGDGKVNSSDLDIVRANWGTSVPVGDLAQGDANGDGKVNSSDLDIVRANWGNQAPVAAAATPKMTPSGPASIPSLIGPGRAPRT